MASSKKWPGPNKIFFAIFSENVALFKKNCQMKKYSKPHFLLGKKKKKSYYIHFYDWTSPTLEKGRGAQKRFFCHFLRKYRFFLKKLLNNIKYPVRNL